MERPAEEILSALQERAKELNCLYQIDELLTDDHRPESELFAQLVSVLPQGWQFPDSVHTELQLGDEVWTNGEHHAAETCIEAPVLLDGEELGKLRICYRDERPDRDEGPFLAEERKLLNTIANRIAQFLAHRALRMAVQSYQTAVDSISSEHRREWGVILDFLHRTDPDLLRRITRKMINFLCWRGVRAARDLLGELPGLVDDLEGENRPSDTGFARDLAALTEPTFEIAYRELGEAQILSCIHRWIREDKTNFLATVLERRDSTLQEVVNALDRYQSMSLDEDELPASMRMMLRVSLLQRFFTEQLDFVTVAKKSVRISTFQKLAHRIVAPMDSRGKLGGKSAGLFLAMEIIEGQEHRSGSPSHIRCPKSYYLSSDVLAEFIHFNDLEDLYSRKYMELDEIRSDYPRIISLFKSSVFPPDVVKGLSLALDDLEQSPLIVRSSSLLEDRSGSAFSGKYKSLFLANRGTKRQRLTALLDAIAEVLASTFGPDPIEYRMDRNLLDVREEMGIIIQEVVGKQIGDYYFPAFSGVAFSRNDFRWSPRIRAEDGLLRIVPGLGTRAVDRLSDDYPVLFSLAHPELRVNTSPDDIRRYSPRRIDVINLHANRFETLDIRVLLERCGGRYPAGQQVFSRLEGDRISRPIGLSLNPKQHDYVATFDGIVQAPFFKQMQELMTRLEQETQAPVDLEFAHDGEHLHVLQCRAQSHASDAGPVRLPLDIEPSDVVFSAHKHVPNGYVPAISHIVYVDPDGYNGIEQLSHLREVGRAIGHLNNVLPKRRFILIGPGRWGSRGDIKLGVSVTYSDIHNSAMLIEVARRRGNYLPDLSFGTHFFQDLVEANIRYLPLYPDDDGVVFREDFFVESENRLAEILPNFAGLAPVIRVVEVGRVRPGHQLQIWMSADEDRAIAALRPV